MEACIDRLTGCKYGKGRGWSELSDVVHSRCSTFFVQFVLVLCLPLSLYTSLLGDTNPALYHFLTFFHGKRYCSSLYRLVHSIGGAAATDFEDAPVNRFFFLVLL